MEQQFRGHVHLREVTNIETVSLERIWNTMVAFEQVVFDLLAFGLSQAASSVGMRRKSKRRSNDINDRELRVFTTVFKIEEPKILK